MINYLLVKISSVLFMPVIRMYISIQFLALAVLNAQVSYGINERNRYGVYTVKY